MRSIKDITIGPKERGQSWEIQEIWEEFFD
jgi:hypothetical protein